MEMDRLGFEIVSVRPEPGPPGRWNARWRPKDAPRTVSFGASGETAYAALRAALMNASDDFQSSYERS